MAVIATNKCIFYTGGGAAILAVSSFVLYNYHSGVTSKGSSLDP